MNKRPVFFGAYCFREDKKLTMDNHELKTKSMDYSHIERIMQDMQNGVMAIDKTGHILYSNPKMNSFFETEDMSGESIQSMMLSNDNAANEDFWDTILYAVYGHTMHYHKKIKYVSPSGKEYTFSAASSYLEGCSREEAKGVVLTVADETAHELALQKKHETTIMLISMLILVCISVFVAELHTFTGGAFPHSWIARATELSAFIIILLFLKYTSLNLHDFGIASENPKLELGEGILIAGLMLLVISLGKLGLMFLGSDFFPADKPFFDFRAVPVKEYFTYAIVAFLQEMMSRCGLQKSLKKILEGKHADTISVIVTSFMFMAVHNQHGLVFMMGAGILNAVLAIIYNRHNSLLETFIVHYSFGVFGQVLYWI